MSKKVVLLRVGIASKPTVATVRSRCRVAQSSGGLDLLVFDNLSLLGSTIPRVTFYDQTTLLTGDGPRIASHPAT